LEIAMRDPQSDGLLVTLAPQGMTDPSRVAESLKPYAKGYGKPILASWMGGKLVAGAIASLNEAGIPTFAYPDTAARAFDYMWRYSYNLQGLYEVPSLAEEVDAGDKSREHVAAILQKVRNAGRTVLTEVESKQVLAAYKIPTVETRIATSSAEATSAAKAIGFPVVLKVYSETITHKTDVGGVKLNLANEDAVAKAYREIETAVRDKAAATHFQGVTVQPMVRLDGYELILGSSLDPQFGPVVLFGSGGQLVEVYRDRALALPPLNATLAQRLMEQTNVYTALKGVRGRAPVDLGALQRILIRFSRLVVEQRWIKEIDINPLLASPDRLIVLDARVDRACFGSRDRKAAEGGHPAVPEPVRWDVEDEGRDECAASPDSPGRRTAHGEVPRNALRTNRLSALFSHGASNRARGPREVASKMLYRL
jgi:acetyltransferase